jgi:hypothetical protein
VDVKLVSPASMHWYVYSDKSHASAARAWVQPHSLRNRRAFAATRPRSAACLGEDGENWRRIAPAVVPHTRTTQNQ